MAENQTKVGWLYPAHQSSNPRFDICVSHQDEIFFHWEATFLSIARCLW
jgi:hypothetical protein